MTLFSELERLLTSEKSIVSATGAELSGTNYGVFDVPAGGAIFTYQFTIVAASSNLVANSRLLINGEIYANGGVGAIGENSYSGMFYLPEGHYTNLTIENGISGAPITAFRAGLLLFKDLRFNALQSWSGQTLQTAWPISVTSQAPPTRKTPIGSITKSILFAQVYVQRAGGEKFDDATESNAWAVKLKIDGVRVNWTKKTMGNTGSTIGSTGQYIAIVDAGLSHTIEVSCTGVPAVVYNTLRLSVINCPWLLSDEPNFPVQTLEFSRGSTLYVNAEPLFDNPTTKSVRVGKKRCCSFGDASDYYGISTGSGVLAFSYKFDAMPPKSCLIEALGFGGCIAIVGVDRV